ncbi:MAG: entericidin A/B family lipoprotein [Oceanicaulis sp.]
MKAILSAALLGVCLISLSACNTIQGVGRDITRAGEALEDATD